MTSPYFSFLNRFSNHKALTPPLLKAPHVALEDLYAHVGVGWFKGNLIHILDPIIILDAIKIMATLTKLQNKVPFAINALGDLLLLDPKCLKIDFFDFSNNSLQTIADSVELLVNEKLHSGDFHPLLNAPLISTISANLGQLTTAEIYKAKLPILLGGEKKMENYQKSQLLPFWIEMVTILQQWETL